VASNFLTIKAGDDVLKHYANGLGALGDYRGRQVMARALNRAGMPALTGVRRALVVRTSAPRSIVVKQVTADKAYAGEASGALAKLEFRVRATGNPIELREFKPREFGYGVRVKVWGRVQRYGGAFMSGGVWPDRKPFGSRPGMNTRVFVRETRQRLPIKQLWGPSLPKELLQREIVTVFEKSAERLSNSIAHELDRELSKFS